MKIYFTIISCLISLSGMASEEPFIPTRWEIELNRLDDIVAKEYKKKYQLYLEASGGGGISGFWQYSPQFKRYYPAPKIEARQLLFEMAEDLLCKINANKVLVEGMISYPFNPDNISHAVIFVKPSGHEVDYGEIEIAAMNGDTVKYSIAHPTSLCNWERQPLEQELREAGATREEFPRLWAYVDELNAKKTRVK